MPQSHGAVLLGPGQNADETLAALIRRLSTARAAEEIMAVVTYGVRTLLKADGATFVLRDGDRCHYAQEDAISPLWKGRRFPLRACISGWCMLQRRPAIVPDIYADARIPLDAYRPTFVRSLAMVPVGPGEPAAALGAYWSEKREPSAEEVHLLQQIADAAGRALRQGRAEAQAAPSPAPAPAAQAARPAAAASGGARAWLERLRRRGPTATSTEPYAFAVLCVLTATLLREAVRATGVTGLATFSTFYPAVLLATVVGGRRAGALAAALGGLAAYYFFMPPLYRFAPTTASDALNLTLYGGACALMIAIIAAYKRMVQRLREEDARHLTLAREQAHRVQNAVSVAESVVRQSLRQDPERAGLINRRMRAALAQVDIRPRPGGEAKSIGALMADELQGFDLSRFELAGQDETPLAPAVGALLALAIHELATNALKYGALSAPAGGVAIDWTIEAGRARIRWREHGGPPVTPPQTRGYGAVLLGRLIESAQGALALDFRRDGLVADITLPLAPARRR